jgi:hypothetical protein
MAAVMIIDRSLRQGSSHHSAQALLRENGPGIQ